MDGQFYTGLGISIVSWFGRYVVNQMPKPVALSGVISGLILMGAQFLDPSTRPPFQSILFGIVGVVSFALAAHFYLARDLPSQKAPTALPAAPLASDVPAFGGLDEVTQRKLMLENRSKLELAARDAAGTSATVEFEQQAIFPLSFSFDSTRYAVAVSLSGAIECWVYADQESARKLYIVRSAERGKPIDIRTIRPSKGSDTIKIGQRAFFELNDGRILQIILVGVLYYRAGDDKDELRFKYKVYEAGEFLIDAL